MTPVEDPRLRFYLERRDTIDEWARLRDLEPPEAARFFRTVANPLQLVAEELGDNVRAGLFTIEAEDVVALYRDHWFPLGAEWPTALVGLGWWPKSSRFSPREAGPWAGLRVRRSDTFQPLRTAVGALVQERSIGRAEFPSGNPTKMSPWVRFSYEGCTMPGYWADLEPYRKHLVDRLVTAYSVFGDAVDEVLSGWSPSA